MPKPRALRIVSERPAMPPRPEDLAATAPVPVAPPPGPDVLAELRRQRDEAVANANAAMQRGQEISEAAQRHVSEANARAEAAQTQATERVKQVALETQTVRADLAKAVEAQKQTGAVATAVVLGIVKQIIEALGRCLTWLPALGSLGGGFWLFAKALAQPTPLALVALALYGGVVVAPASLLTLRK